MTSSAAKVSTAPSLQFDICDARRGDMKFVESAMKERLEPLYGSQKAAIEKVRNSKDRRCDVLLDHGVYKGLVIYKFFPTNEFHDYGVKRSVEIKTLFLFHPKEDGGHGYGRALVDRVTSYAQSRFVDALGVHVTASSAAPESIKFFEHLGFHCVASFVDRYVKGNTEKLFHFPVQKRREEQPVQSSSSSTRIESIPAMQPSSSSARVESIPLKKEYVMAIASGAKTKEGRLNIGQFQRLRPGQVIRFFSGPLSVTCRIDNIKKYNTFRQMLEDGGIKSFLPRYNNIDQAVALYHSFPNYEANEKRFGTLSLSLTVIPEKAKMSPDTKTSSVKQESNDAEHQNKRRHIGSHDNIF